jgi:hypothetical protein
LGGSARLQNPGPVTLREARFADLQIPSAARRVDFATVPLGFTGSAPERRRSRVPEVKRQVELAAGLESS